MFVSLTEITKFTSGHLVGEDVEISNVGIDTRILSSGDLYVAIKGEKFDGHQFIAQAEQAGAVAVLVEQPQDTELAQIIVNNSRVALAQLGALWRQKSGAKILAVTGSNGKTTVKEMLAAILSVNASVLATRGNLNNEIGVPLTLLRLTEQHQYAVIEMGANHANEIAFVSAFAQANVGLINNVGAAHLEGFGSLEGVAKAKAEIITGLSEDGTAILNKADDFYPLWLKLADQRPVISFALEDTSAEVYASEISLSIEKQRITTKFRLHAGLEEAVICLQLAGKHNINNALAVSAAALAVDIPLAQIKQGLESVVPVTGRLQPYLSRFGNIVIDDSYNANPTSLKVALDVLMQYEGEPWLILGAFGELGYDSVKLHQQMGKDIKQQGVMRLFAVGEDAAHSVESFGEGGLFFESQQKLQNFLITTLKGNETLLIKGSRAQRMENVAAALIDNFRI